MLANAIASDTWPKIGVGTFDSLADQHYKKVLEYAYRLAKNRSDAEDVTQEAFYRACRSFDTYEGGRSFENWMFRIVTRVFLDLLRSRRRRVKYVSFDAPFQHLGEEQHFLEPSDEQPSPEDQLLAGTLSDEIRYGLSTLTKEQMKVVKLADIEDVPYAEMASQLNKPIGTIRSSLHRAHRQLRIGFSRAETKRVAKETEARLSS